MQSEPRWWRWGAVLGLLLGLLVRAWPWLSQPLLALEDGAVFFARNYAGFEWGAATHPYAGYVPFGSNVLALLSCRLPTDWIPTAFVAVAIVMTLGGAGALLRPAWQAAAPFRVRCLLAVALVMVPFGSNLEFTSLAYAQWPQMLWLFLLLLEPKAAARAHGVARSWRAGLVVFLTMTNPLSVVLLPLGLASQVRRSGRSDWACFVAAVFGYWLVSILVIEEHISPDFAALWSEMVPTLAVNVVVEAILGVEGALALARAGALPLAGVATLLCGGIAAVVSQAWPRWPRAARLLVLASVWLLLATVASSLIARPGWRHGEQHCVRYVWLGRAAIWIMLTLAAATVWRLFVAALVVGAVGSVLLVGNARMHYHPGTDRDLSLFLADLQQQERQHGGRRGVRARLDRPSGLRIVIRPR